MTKVQQIDPIQQLYSSIGYLAEISLGDFIEENTLEVRSEQLGHIINWTNLIKQDLDAQHNLRVHLQQELERLRFYPNKEELLVAVDTGIQEQMKQLNVDIQLGGKLLPKIMDIVDINTFPLSREIDTLKIDLDKVVLQLNQARAKIQTLERNIPQVNMIESQIVTSSLTGAPGSNLGTDLKFAQQKIKQLEGIIGELEQNNLTLNGQLSNAKNKNQQLVQQMLLSNARVQEIEKKILQNPSKGNANNSSNDANIRIINQLKSDKQALNRKINELVQQVIDANAKFDQGKAKKSGNSSPVREPVEHKSSSSDPKIKQLEIQLISKQEEIYNLTIEVRNADARIKQLIDELMAANGQLITYKSRGQNVGSSNVNGQDHQEIVSNANRRIQELMNQYSDANNRIAELEQQLSKNHYRKEQIHQKQETQNIELGTQLANAQHRIDDLINQLAISSNRITDLELDIEAMNRQALDKNNAIGYQRKMQAVSHELLVANNKVEEMMKMVANYQNNVIDLELDKEALIFQLNDARNKQDDYFDELKVERASTVALKQQVIKMKESYYQATKGNIRNIQSEINNRGVGGSIQKPSVQGEIVNINDPVHLQVGEKSEKSFREHRKIFDGKIRGSHASSRKEAN